MNKKNVYTNLSPVPAEIEEANRRTREPLLEEMKAAGHAPRSRNPRHPKLESFLHNLAYCVLSHDAFYEICDAAGVNWLWPQTFAGDVVKEFIEKGGLKDREGAVKQMRNVYSILENTVTNLSKMPTSIEDIRQEYRALSKLQQVLDVATNMLRDPEGYEQYIASLDLGGSTDVVTFDYEQIRANYGIVYEEIKAGKAMVGIHGYSGLTELTGGFNAGRITVLLADSGFGKTNFCMNLAYAAANTMDVGYMNLEMTLDDITKRTSVLLAEKTWGELFSGDIKPDELPEKTRYELRFSDGQELHVDSIIAWCKGFKRTNPNFKILFIDYDQKMELSTSRDVQEWKAMQLAFRALEKMANAIGIHIFISAQVNSEGEISSSKRAIFTAHTVLSFVRHNGEPIVHNKTKHRHARGPRALPVRYDYKSASVKEAGVLFDFDENSGDSFRDAIQKKKAADSAKFNKGLPYKES